MVVRASENVLPLPVRDEYHRVPDALEMGLAKPAPPLLERARGRSEVVAGSVDLQHPATVPHDFWGLQVRWGVVRRIDSEVEVVARVRAFFLGSALEAKLPQLRCAAIAKRVLETLRC